MIRQKGFDIFIKPYTMYKDNSNNTNRLIHKGDVFIRTPGTTNSNSYSVPQGGECYIKKISNHLKKHKKKLKILWIH